jgi:hypothetical protein
VQRLRVFGNRVLKTMFVLKRDEVTGGWKQPHDLFSSPCIIIIIKSRKKRWPRQVVVFEEKMNLYKLW